MFKLNGGKNAASAAAKAVRQNVTFFAAFLAVETILIFSSHGCGGQQATLSEQEKKAASKSALQIDTSKSVHRTIGLEKSVLLGSIAIRLDSLTGSPPDSCQANLTLFDSTAAIQTAFQILLPEKITYLDAQGNSYEIHVLTVQEGNAVEAFAAIDSSQAKHQKRAVASQNYPNPFNPATTITYDLPEQSHVKISVFNLLGAEVAVLVDAQQPPGAHTAVFDGSKFPNGAYFYKILYKNFGAVKKMLLLK
jgi:hypothetical protein